ncbi:MAG: threonine--tRNA ligase, partial [Oscillospiraceae bacterium]
IGPGLAKAACACTVDGEACDLRTPIAHDCTLSIETFDTPEGKHAFWHTASHVMAEAVMRLYPQAKLTIGPAIENGFYYDIDCDVVFTPETLAKIESEMKNIVAANEPLERFTLTRDKALELMSDNPYKIELINDLPADAVLSFYREGSFTDLCAGPHLMSTGALAAVKLLNVTGAYWRADAKNKMLQRVY